MNVLAVEDGEGRSSVVGSGIAFGSRDCTFKSAARFQLGRHTALGTQTPLNLVCVSRLQ